MLGSHSSSLCPKSCAIPIVRAFATEKDLIMSKSKIRELHMKITVRHTTQRGRECQGLAIHVRDRGDIQETSKTSRLIVENER